MAERRMFAKKIVDSDDFIELPDLSKVLYFYLCMSADDDGFCSSPRKVMRSCGANDGDMRVLIQKRFVISFPEGVVVIRHWKIHNYIRSDRYKESEYKKLYKELYLKDGVYDLGDNLDTIGIPSDNQLSTDCHPQVKVEYKNTPNIEDIVNNNIIDFNSKSNLVDRNKLSYGLFNNVSLSEEEYGLLTTKYPSYYEKYINKLSSYMASTGKAYASHYATIISWLERDRIEPVAIMTEEEQMEAHKKRMEEFERLLEKI